ncbi:MAG: tRNA (guanosine(37)-N1)-methyltransferase TrmD [Candidatus Caenarcaniphilales bacterium]|nr:tRNA (guanosine(37)-N1)-methyltransferase TrmD [Candidatus Caenarcaniphilales bacterium]
MRFEVITLFPEVIEAYARVSIVGRAWREGLIEICTHQLRNHGIGNYRQVDDRPYGGGTGQILKPEPIFAAQRIIPKLGKNKTILFTPRGVKLSQRILREDLAAQDQLILICGHYEGYDERITTLADHCLSLGNFVLTGGELGALVVIDAVTRLQEGVFSKGDAVHQEDSFSDEEANKLEAPQYTRPAEFEGMKVPKVLLSGNHQEIQAWREAQSKARPLDV